MYKLIGLFALVAVVVGNDLTVGSNNDGSKVYDQKLEASPAIWRQVKNFTINATEGDVISRVVITDLRPEKDGEAQVVEGGEGQKNVTIELKSPAVFRGFEFNVEVYAVPDKSQHGVPTEQPKSDKTTEGGLKVPISVSGDVLDDNQRKTRRTEEEDKENATPKPFVSNEHSTTPSSTTAVHQSTTVPSKPALVLVKNNGGEKIYIPIGIGKDIKPEVVTTPKQNEPIEKNGESDIIDPTAVSYQPTHLNNTEKSSTEKSEATDKTTMKAAVHVSEVTTEGLTDTKVRNARSTETYSSSESEGTTELTSTTIESTSDSTSDSTSSEEDLGKGEIPFVPYNWGNNFPYTDTVQPIGNKQNLTPPKTIGSDNVAVQGRPAGMVPLPYNH